MLFKKGEGNIIGSFWNINYNDVIREITVTLSNSTDKNIIGRHVRAAIFYAENDVFDINKLKDIDYIYSESENIILHSGVSCRNSNVKMPIHKSLSYVDTSSIPRGRDVEVTFKFTEEKTIPSEKIFVALICDYSHTDFNENELFINTKTTPALCYVTYSSSSAKLINDQSCSLNIVSYLAKHINGEIDGDNSIDNRDKIRCNKITYRTHSEPLTRNIIGSYSKRAQQLIDPKLANSNNDSTFFYHNGAKYLYSYLDGGENYGDITTISSDIHGTVNELFKYYKPQIINKNGEKFNDDFYIPEGKLKDVEFKNPELGGYEQSNVTNSLPQPRWVFKRSRIKFSIPPLKKQDGTIDSSSMIIRYKIETAVYDKNAYSTNWKQYTYNSEESRNDINIVICPRDEGVLDNMPFRVIFSRRKANSKFNDWCEDMTYYFHTYQKPIINIAYPKMIRNRYTDNKPDTSNEIDTNSKFKWPQIITSNMYSNFEGENSIVNKYVCDALNVLLSSSPNDASDIPQFVRFYLAEYKFGRYPGIKQDIKDKDGNKIGEEFVLKSDDTLQALYRSTDPNDYSTLNDILSNNGEKRTAFLTSIANNDNASLLFSGRFNNDVLEDIGKNYKLWTYNVWDKVETDNDIDVSNAWPTELPAMKDKILKDHETIVVTSDGNKTHEFTNALLFRAGYIYLLRVRLFHGAAAGAIGTKYSRLGTSNEIIYGKYGTGSYDYSNPHPEADYSGQYPYVVFPNGNVMLDDNERHGDLHLYEQYITEYNNYIPWVGPHDGTSGITLTNDYNFYLNQTFPGFSEVDYTIIEPVCPYVSKSNLVTVHPTSSNISVNQWITFSYRHLSKNRADIDTWVPDSKNEYVSKSLCFGVKNTGVHNTVTRIMSTYDACVRHILETLQKDIGTTKDKNYVDIWIDPILNVNERDYVEEGNYRWKYKVGLNKYPIASYDEEITVKPLISNLLLNESTNYQLDDSNIYNDNCGLHCFKERYNGDGSVLFVNESEENASEKAKNKYDTWPECQVIFKQFTTQSNVFRIPVADPLGNVYRWQPVINAMTFDNSEKKMKEIKIEDNSTNHKDAKAFVENNIKSFSGVSRNLENTIYSSTLTRSDGNDNDTIINPVTPAYISVGNKYYNLQTKYAYVDNCKYDDCEHDSKQYPNGLNFKNNQTIRFSINEFFGLTTDAGDSSSGYPVMYTTVSYVDSSEEYGVFKDFKFFTLKDTTNAIRTNKHYGKLFQRVPHYQDCENGYIPIDASNINVGNLSALASIELSKNNETYNSLNDIQNVNITPLVRTTHYLYFKTHINTSFYCQIKNEKYMTREDGSNYYAPPEYYLYRGGSLIHVGSLPISLTYSFNSKSSYLNKDNKIKYGNDGISEIYGEDNFGWGRCLSAEDMSSRPIDRLGNILDNPTLSGGIEVPILVRYTPLLQPKLVSEIGIDNNNNNSSTILVPGNKHVTLVESQGQQSVSIRFADGNSNSNLVNMEMEEYKLNIGYPFIPENNSYSTKSPNGGMGASETGNTGLIYHDNYYFDIDSYPTTVPGANASNTNMDFLGGYGICTAYNIFLVPSDPRIDKQTDFELKHYFNATDGHWNYFKQPANYFGNDKICKDVESKSVSKAKAVLVAYNVQLNDNGEYLTDGEFSPNKWTDGNKYVKQIKGRNFQSIPLNFKRLRQGYVYCGIKNGSDSQNDYVYINNIKTKYPELSNITSTHNTLQPGVTYDLVIVPVYSNFINKTYCYEDGVGTINGQTFGGGDSDRDVNIHFAGSNPLVLFNYLQVSAQVIKRSEESDNPSIERDPELPTIPENKILDIDACIMFPNVDNKKYNLTTGKYKECPGFWLNNSFKLILRMPAFRHNNEAYSYIDENTINNASNGVLSDKNESNDFRFGDIQIHIGKIDELKPYGYPNNMHLNLNKITNKDELAKLNIYSYSHYANSGVFSKKLNDEDNNDDREILTGGALHPINKSNEIDKNYKNRFIEVNLSKLNISTLYPEGYYIQFRWKSAYASGEKENDWSPWIGGSNDGGYSWWGDNGTDYYVPIRNYSDIHTDFRNYIKESYPGSMIQTTVVKDNINNKITHHTTGMGSLMSYGEYDESSKTKPQNSKNDSYYMLGLGNKESSNNWNSISDTMLVPDFFATTAEYSTTDNCFTPQYILTHDTNFSIPDNISNLHQTMWEMLYVDYVIRNMCKLYYKAEYNDVNDNDKSRWFESEFTNGNKKAGARIYYHSAVPYIINNDATNAICLNSFKYLKILKDKNNNEIVETIIDEQWHGNKYHRKPITLKDFDNLHLALVDLTKFIRNNVFTGITDKNSNLLNSMLSVHENDLMFDGKQQYVIGHDLAGNPGLDRINNVNHTMLHGNYIQTIWNEILMLCNTENSSITYTNITI